MDSAAETGWPGPNRWQPSAGHGIADTVEMRTTGANTYLRTAVSLFDAARMFEHRAALERTSPRPLLGPRVKVASVRRASPGGCSAPNVDLLRRPPRQSAGGTPRVTLVDALRPRRAILAVQNTPPPRALPTSRMRAAQIAVAAIALAVLTWGTGVGVDLGAPVWAVAGLSMVSAALIGAWLILEARPATTVRR